MNKHKTTHFPLLDSPDGSMICPRCRELLMQADVETYRRCPFCDYPFDRDAAFEDYLLQPVVELWIRSSGQELFMPASACQEQPKNIFL